jgi:hypothetical protein
MPPTLIRCRMPSRVYLHSGQQSPDTARTWTLRQKMPAIPNPLQKDEPEPMLDLQALAITPTSRWPGGCGWDQKSRRETPVARAAAMIV